jgi:hypothetical protein
MSTSIPSLAELLDTHQSYITLTTTNKIKCSVSGHEMPPRSDVVNSYINSSKFQKLIKWYSFNFDIFLPYIVQDKKANQKMHCKLTNQSLNKIPDEIKKHMNGKKFLRLKKEQDYINQENEDEKLDIWVPPEEELEDEVEYKPNPKKSKKIVDDLSDLIDSDEELVIDDDEDEKEGDDDDDDNNNNNYEVEKEIVVVKTKSIKDKSSKTEEAKAVKSYSSKFDKKTKTSKKGKEVKEKMKKK